MPQYDQLYITEFDGLMQKRRNPSELAMKLLIGPWEIWMKF